MKVTFPVLSFAKKKVGRTVGGVGVVFSISDRRRRPVSLVITSRYGETLEYVVLRVGGGGEGIGMRGRRERCKRCTSIVNFNFSNIT